MNPLLIFKQKYRRRMKYMFKSIFFWNVSTGTQAVWTLCWSSNKNTDDAWNTCLNLYSLGICQLEPRQYEPSVDLETKIKVCLWNTMPPAATKSKKLFLASRSKPRSQGHWPWCHLKGLHKLSMHAKYEVSISYGSKVISKVKVDDRQTNRQTGQKQYAPDHSIRAHKNTDDAWNTCINLYSSGMCQLELRQYETTVDVKKKKNYILRKKHETFLNSSTEGIGWGSQEHFSRIWYVGYPQNHIKSLHLS